jgi:hypothetical protein
MSAVGGKADATPAGLHFGSDPNQTFASFAGLGYTAIGESATGAVCDSARSSAGPACRLKLCAELIKPTWLKTCGKFPSMRPVLGVELLRQQANVIAARNPFARPRGIA